MAAQEDKIKCEECNAEFTNVSGAIQHKFRKHKQSNLKHYCPSCGQQFPIKVRIKLVSQYFNIVLIWYWFIFASTAAINTFNPIHLQERAAFCIYVWNAVFHFIMLMPYNIMQNQFTTGYFPYQMFLMLQEINLVSFLELWSWSKQSKLRPLPARSNAITPRNRKVFITATCADPSI